MEAKLNSLQVQRTAHFYTLGAEAQTATDIWLVLHGYGQLASRIIRKFDQLNLDKIHVIAPEALSKFYFKRTPLTLGASWMTSHQREDEKTDYLSYLDDIYNTLNVAENQRFNVLGFSQGSSTMIRWVQHAQPKLHKLVNWAGEFPHDIDYQSFVEYAQKVPIKYYCHGDQDEFVTPKRVEKISSIVSEKKLGFELRPFVGKHAIDRNVLKEIVES